MKYTYLDGKWTKDLLKKQPYQTLVDLGWEHEIKSRQVRVAIYNYRGV